jgi:hypothetical protein
MKILKFNSTCLRPHRQGLKFAFVGDGKGDLLRDATVDIVTEVLENERGVVTCLLDLTEDGLWSRAR